MKAKITPWLNEVGFSWPNDRAAIEACQKPKTLLEVIFKVLHDIEPGYIRNVLLQQNTHIGFEKRKKFKGQSRLVDLMVVRNIFYKSGAKFRFV